MSRHQRLGVGACFFCAALVVSAAPSDAKDESAKPVPLPGGVMDRSAKVGYVQKDATGIDAVDLDNGKKLWSTKDAFQPLLVFNNNLIALAAPADKTSSFAIVVLDPAQEGKVLKSYPVKVEKEIPLGQFGFELSAAAHVE